MKTTETKYSERVAKMVETCDGEIVRTFYCIHDPKSCHWMSTEPFGEMIWTKVPECRREFYSRSKAESELERFLSWRDEKAIWDDATP
jgi:hypothetical protein